MDYAANIITPASMLYDFIPNSDLIEEEEEEFETIDLIYEEEEDQEHMDDYVDFKNYVYDNIEQINQLLEFGELDSELFSGSTKMPPTTTTSSSTIEGRFLETCQQAKTSKSGQAIFFFFRRVRATSMTQRRVENTRVHF